ncbi:disease resistance protein SUMM2-like [Hevea brasiliensis]|uniref:disease resistance protein SUMM2-like n=1 Tax=Hevea brasiliensis TaxID=3981 RepID=UPI0025EA5F44|nr:disease resistance protein SUMM2-like [Hevea brasiliensis]
MAGKTKPRDWERAIEKLNTQPSSFPDVEASVLPVLKISYDSLSTDNLRKCFLYFSLFPGVDNIKKMELTELWIAEGFLDQSNSTYEAREEGEDALGSLKSASLLESGKSEDFVKMHDVIQAMTLWLAREEGKAEDKVLVREKTPQLSKWINAERISLCGASFESLPEAPSCHHLTTLLLRATNLKILPSEFFQSMPALKVLDLSDNEGLIELPVGIGNLTNLRYLNLSGTCIEILPMEVQNLKKLQSLILDRTPPLLTIPMGVISSLSSLQAFRRVFDQILILNSPLDDEVELLKELESLEHIDEIGIFLSYASFVQKVLDSDTHKLRRRIKQLQLVQGTDHPPKLSLRGMEHLERLELLKCSSLTEVEIVKEIISRSLRVLISMFPPTTAGEKCRNRFPTSVL